MNYIKHLTTYFDKVTEDHSLNPTHISLYMALFQYWNFNRFKNPMCITRDEVMQISKIGSRATYHKCMRELHEKGYIIYEPSYNPFHGSKVQMINLSDEQKIKIKNEQTESINKQVVEQAQNKSQTSDGTATEQELVSSINNTNSTNNINILNSDEIKKVSKNKKFENKSEGSNPKPVACHPVPIAIGITVASHNPEPAEASIIPPNQENVKQFFITQNATTTDAEKFCNHYESNGWLIGGKSKMKDWKAAARNWILNSKKFNTVQTNLTPKHLNTSIQKNYGEPL